MDIDHKQRYAALGIIPARLNSSRLPSKLLRKINGKTIIQLTYENTLKATTLDQVVIATDSELIFEEAQSFGANVILTSKTCLTGTERVIEAYEKFKHLPHFDIVVNVQGDEPIIETALIDSIVNELRTDNACMVATAASPITSEEEACSPSVVKCVINHFGHALYFSRALIPSGKSPLYSSENTYYKHLGIYAFKASFLQILKELPATKLQLAEDLEQLKILEHGYPIKVVIAKSSNIGVDTFEDLIKLENLLCTQSSSLSQAASALHLEKV